MVKVQKCCKYPGTDGGCGQGTEFSHLYLHPKPTQMTVQELEKIASQVRRDIVRMVHGVQSGHPGGSLGCADFVTALYFEVMKRNPGFSMDGIGEEWECLKKHLVVVRFQCESAVRRIPVGAGCQVCG